ncbi:hypothetical protein AFI02nite_41580 [Aliivibrio fischeri]|uniref:Uncharacterized protein n=1 Tax=Aliivibrio fischeri TaxID=668 RepID=A0A510UN82_ALIFS|nr:hypothetical protein AFI02nite_41580 [Aliivibrio fischeri]
MTKRPELFRFKLHKLIRNITMHPHLLLVIFSFGSVSFFAYTQGDESEFFMPFWYAGVSVAHNNSRWI